MGRGWKELIGRRRQQARCGRRALVALPEEIPETNGANIMNTWTVYSGITGDTLATALTEIEATIALMSLHYANECPRMIDETAQAVA